MNPIEFQEIDLSSIKPGSALVFRLDTDNLARVRRFVDWLSHNHPDKLKDNLVLMLSRNETLEVLNERTMNAHGWYRRDRTSQSVDIADPEVVEIDIRADRRVVWVNVNGRCLFRCQGIKQLEVLNQTNESDDQKGNKSGQLREGDPGSATGLLDRLPDGKPGDAGNEQKG